MLRSDFTFNFPRITGENAADSIGGQFSKVVEELNELNDEIEDDAESGKVSYKTLIEALDTLHAIEGVIVMIAEEGGLSVNEARFGVIQKNFDRGYYRRVGDMFSETVSDSEAYVRQMGTIALADKVLGYTYVLPDEDFTDWVKRSVDRNLIPDFMSYNEFFEICSEVLLERYGRDKDRV